VPTPEARGAMLAGYRRHLQPNGHLFLMLPLLCLTNSRHMSVARFEAVLQRAGFAIVAKKNSPKVAFYCCVAATSAPAKGDAPVLLHGLHGKQGKGRMDFSVVL
jgi:25S rRNA (adenine(2142)-N(1))-methyltransferase, Bmt2